MSSGASDGLGLGPGHDWVRAQVVQCLYCGARPHWPLAARSCAGKRVVAKGVERLSAPELVSELGRALDMCSGGAGYRCVSPISPYGRDGRKRGPR